MKSYSDIRWFLSTLETTKNKIDRNENIGILLAGLATDITERIRNGETENNKVKDLMQDFEKMQQTNYESVKNGGLIGFSFGYKFLDEAISGIRPPHYIVVKAGTNIGKSAFALNITSEALNQGKKVVLFSLEMSKNQNIARIIAMRTNKPPLEVESGNYILSTEEIDEKARIYDQRLTIYENKLTINDIIMTAQAENAEEKVDLFVIDYLQNIAIQGNRYDSFTDSSQKIQHLCKRLNTPFLVASQINKEGEARGSGDIDNHSDFAVSLTQGEQYGFVELMITKNRHGSKGSTELKYSNGGKLEEIENNYLN